jgi:hypothetical protein
MTVAVGALSCVYIAVIGRGGVFHAAGVFFLTVAFLALAVLVNAVSYTWKREVVVPLATVAVGVGAFVLSLPVGSVLNQWDVRRAKEWCEQHTAGLGGLRGAEHDAYLREHLRPMLADVPVGDPECHVSDRKRLFFGEWVYTPEAGWEYWD